MPVIQRNKITASNIVYTTGVYINPQWLVSLAPVKVGSGNPYWNASEIQGYPVSTGIPTSGQVLAWTSSGWIPSGITGGGGENTSSLGFVTLDGTSSGLLSSTAQTAIDSYPISSGNCIKYIIKATYLTAIHTSEILLASDGIDSYMTEYGIVYSSGNLVNFSANYSGSNIVLYATPSYANTTIKIFKTIIN